MPVAPVLNYEEVKVEPQFRENGYVVEVQHPSYGTYTTVGVPAKYSHTPALAVGIAPGR